MVGRERESGERCARERERMIGVEERGKETGTVTQGDSEREKGEVG